MLLSFSADQLTSIRKLAIAVAITWTVLFVDVIGILPRPALFDLAGDGGTANGICVFWGLNSYLSHHS